MTPPAQPAIHPTPSARHRFHVLDALRGLAAMLVIFWHAPAFARSLPAFSTFRAVDFFFCLSGFVLAFSYEGRLRANLGMRQFLAARLIRLYPVYLLAILAGLVLSCQMPLLGRHGWLFTSATPLFCFQLFLLPGIPTSANPWLFPLDFPAWSIFFELLANLAFAFLVRTRRARTGYLVLLILGSLLALAAWAARGGTVDAGAYQRVSVLLGLPRVLLSFFAGVLSFRLFHHRGATHWSQGVSMAAAVLIGLALVLLLLAPLPALRSRPFSLLTFAVLFPALVYLGAHCRIASVWAPLCSFLGDTSFPFYLLHVHLLRLLTLPATLSLLRLHPALVAWAVPSVIVLTGALSWFVLRFYDVPVRRWLVSRVNHAARSPGSAAAPNRLTPVSF